MVFYCSAGCQKSWVQTFCVDYCSNKFYTLVDIYGPLTNVKRTMSTVGLHLVMSNTISGQKCRIRTTFKIISCFSYSATFLLLLLSSPFSLLSSYLCVTAHFLSPFPFSFSSLSSRHPLLLHLLLCFPSHFPFGISTLTAVPSVCRFSSLIRHFVTSLASFPSFVSLPLLPFFSSSSSSSVLPPPPSLSDVIWSQWIKCHFSAIIKVQFTAAHLRPSSLLYSQSFFFFIFSTSYLFIFHYFNIYNRYLFH